MPESITINYTMETQGNKLILVTTFGKDIYGFGDETMILYFIETQDILDHGS